MHLDVYSKRLLRFLSRFPALPLCTSTLPLGISELGGVPRTLPSSRHGFGDHRSVLVEYRGYTTWLNKVLVFNFNVYSSRLFVL